MCIKFYFILFYLSFELLSIIEFYNWTFIIIGIFFFFIWMCQWILFNFTTESMMQRWRLVCVYSWTSDIQYFSILLSLSIWCQVNFISQLVLVHAPTRVSTIAHRAHHHCYMYVIHPIFLCWLTPVPFYRGM